MRNNYKILYHKDHEIPMIKKMLMNSLSCLFLLCIGTTTSYSQTVMCNVSGEVVIFASGDPSGDGTTTLLPGHLGTATPLGYINTVGNPDLAVDCSMDGLMITLVAATTTDPGTASTATCDVMLVVNDDVPPTASCIGSFGPIEVGTVITADDLDNDLVTSSDACTGVILSLEPLSLVEEYTTLCSDLGTSGYTLYVTDTGGGSAYASCTVSITVEDTSPATVNCIDYPHNLSAGASIDPSDISAPSDCAMTETLSPNSFTCADIADNPIEVTYTVTDASGNTASCTADVTVVDDVAPVLTCTTLALTKVLDGSGSASLTTADIIYSVVETCGVVSEVFSDDAFVCSDVGTTTITFTVSDAAGESDDCEIDVTIEDNQVPMAICKDATISLNAAGIATLNTTDVDNSSTDNCPLTFGLSQTAFNCNDVGSNLVTLTATDAAGSSNGCSATVTVTDGIAPTANCVADFDLNLMGASNIAAITAANINDASSDLCGLASLTIDKTTFDCDDLGAQIVELQVVDVNGQSSTCTTTVTVLENTAGPNAVCQDVTIDLNTTTTVTPAMVDNMANPSTGNCGFYLNNVARSAGGPAVFDCDDFDNSPIEVTLVVSDGGGSTSTATCTANVTILNAVTIEAFCNDITINLDPNGDVAETAAEIAALIDNNSLASSLVTYSGLVNPDASWADNVWSDPSAGTLPVATILVPITAAGAVADIDLGIKLDYQDMTDITITLTDPSGTVTATIFDGGCGANVDNINATFDDEGSVFACSGYNIFSNDDQENCNNYWNVGAAVSGTLQPETDALGVFDGEEAMGNWKVEIYDNTEGADLSPFPAFFNIFVSGGGCLHEASITLQIAEPVSVYCDDLEFAIFPDASTYACADLGDHTIFLTVTEPISGSTAACSSIVTIADVTAPTATCKAFSTSLGAGDDVTILATDIDDGSADECGFASVTIPTTVMDCDNIGSEPLTNTVTLTVSDGTNSSTCMTVVTITDENVPTAECQDITVYLAGTGGMGSYTVTAAEIDDDSYDGCTDPVTLAITSANATVTCADLLATVDMDLVVTDGSTNTHECTAIVTVLDTLKPIITCVTTVVDLVLDSDGEYTIDQTDVLLDHNDDCMISTFLYDRPALFDCYDIGSVIAVHIDAVDQSGNSTADPYTGETVTTGCTTQVQVLDNMAPVITCNDLITANSSAVEVGTTIDPGDVLATASDNCDLLLASFDEAGTILTIEYDCISVGTYTVDVYYTDDNNNQGTCSATIEVVDTTDPIVNCSDHDVYLNSSGIALLVNIDDIASWSDDCGSTLIPSVDINTFGCADGESDVTVTVTVTDVGGNETSCEADVYVHDDNEPTIVGCPPTSASSPIEVALDPSSLEIRFDANDIAMALGVTITDVCAASTYWAFDYYDYAGVNNHCNDKDAGTEEIDYDSGESLSDNTYDCDDEGTIFYGNIVAAKHGDAYMGVEIYDPILDCEYYSNYCQVYVKVITTAGPTAECQNATVSLDSDGTVTVPGSAVDNVSTDECDNVFGVLSPADFDCSHIGAAQVVTYTVYDASGNSDVCTAEITIIDDKAPIAMCNDVVVYLDAAGAGSFTAADFDVLCATTDNCSIASWELGSMATSSFTCADIGGSLLSTAYAYKLDAGISYAPLTEPSIAGSISTNSGNTFAIPIGFDFEFYGETYDEMYFGEYGVASFGAWNNQLDDGSPDVISNGDVFPGLAPFWGYDFDDDGILTIDYFVSGTAPDRIFVADIYGSDIVDGFVADVQLQLYEATGEIQMHYATLVNGDASEDEDISIGVFTNDDKPALGPATATGTAEYDAEEINGTLKTNEATSYMPVIINEVGGGSTMMTLTATDNYGLTDMATCYYAVLDTIAPVVVCEDITVQLEYPAFIVSSDVTLDSLLVSMSDNCTEVMDLVHVDAGDLVWDPGCPLAETIFEQIISVVDESGNIGEATCNVTITGVPPTVVCQDIMVTLDSEGMATRVAMDYILSSGSVCDTLSTSILGLVSEADKVEFDCDDLFVLIGLTEVEVTVTDEDGMTASCTSNVTVIDQIAPTAVCKEDIEVQLVYNTGTAMYEYELTLADISGVSTDNCGTPTASFTPITFDCSDSDLTVAVMLTVTDASSFTGTAMCNVFVDDPAPTPLCMVHTVTLDAFGEGSLVPAQIDGGSTDGCTLVAPTLMASQLDFTCADVGTVNVTLTVTDGGGPGPDHTTTCVAVVTVEDLSVPIAECVDDFTVYLDAGGSALITAADLDDDSSDENCDITLALSAASAQSFDCSDIGITYTVTLEVADGMNTASCMTDVTVSLDPALPCSCGNLDHLVVDDNPIPSGTYIALLTIESEGKVNPTTNVHFKAGESILLLPGFEALLTAEFLAEIGGCP